MKIRLEVRPFNCCDFATREQVSEHLDFYCNVDKFRLIQNNGAAYGCPAYQIVAVSKEAATKIENSDWYKSEFSDTSA